MLSHVILEESSNVLREYPGRSLQDDKRSVPAGTKEDPYRMTNEVFLPAPKKILSG